MRRMCARACVWMDDVTLNQDNQNNHQSSQLTKLNLFVLLLSLPYTYPSHIYWWDVKERMFPFCYLSPFLITENRVMKMQIKKITNILGRLTQLIKFIEFYGWWFFFLRCEFPQWWTHVRLTIALCPVCCGFNFDVSRAKYSVEMCMEIEIETNLLW